MTRGAAAAVLFAAGLVGCGGGRGPAAPAVTATPVPVAAPGEACLTPEERAATVQFPSGSGVKVGGAVLGSGPVAVVLVHEAATDLCQWVPFGRILAQQGYRVLAFDLNGFGSSPAAPGGPQNPAYERDVEAAIDFVRGERADHVIVVGSSLGGLAAITAAVDTRPSIDGLVYLWGPTPPVAGLDAQAAAARLAVPVLFVIAKGDASATEARSVFQAIRAPDRSLVEVPGSTWGVKLLDPTVARSAPQNQQLVEEFVAGHAATVAGECQVSPQVMDASCGP